MWILYESTRTWMIAESRFFAKKFGLMLLRKPDSTAIRTRWRRSNSLLTMDIEKGVTHDHPNTCSRDNPLCFARYTGDRIRICLLVCAVWSVRHNRKIFSSIIGCIISLVDPPHDDIQSSADMVTYTFAVESVAKRNLTEFVEVVSPISDASCWFGYVAKPESHMAITMYLNDHHNYQSGYC